jgi:hypothetical protein
VLNIEAAESSDQRLTAGWAIQQRSNVHNSK